MRENGWLQAVFAAATKRVDEWPKWKKDIETRELQSNRNGSKETPSDSKKRDRAAG